MNRSIGNPYVSFERFFFNRQVLPTSLRAITTGANSWNVLNSAEESSGQITLSRSDIHGKLLMKYQTFMARLQYFQFCEVRDENLIS